MELSKSPMETPSCTCQASQIPPLPTIFPCCETIDIAQRMLREMEAQGKKVYEVVDVDPPSIKASNNHGAQVTWEEKESILMIGSLWPVSSGWDRHESPKRKLWEGCDHLRFGEARIWFNKENVLWEFWLSFLLTLLQCLTQLYGMTSLSVSLALNFLLSFAPVVHISTWITWISHRTATSIWTDLSSLSFSLAFPKQKSRNHCQQLSLLYPLIQSNRHRINMFKGWKEGKKKGGEEEWKGGREKRSSGVKPQTLSSELMHRLNLHQGP